MSTLTTNYRLVKPAGSDNYDISVMNNNFDTLDSTLKTVETRANNSLPITGGALQGPISFSDVSLERFESSPQYLVGIDAFAEGGELKWDTTANITVGAATKATQDGSGNVITSTYSKLPHFIEIVSTNEFTTKTIHNGFYQSGYSYMSHTTRNKYGVNNNMSEYYGGVYIPKIEQYSFFIVELNCGGHTTGSSSQFSGGITLWQGASSTPDGQYNDGWQNQILASPTDNYWKGVMTKIIYVGDRTGVYSIGSVWNTYRGSDFSWNTGFGTGGSTLRVIGIPR